MSPQRKMLALLALATAATLAGCGKRGVLETPPPLFGDRARARYEAEQQQRAQDAADAAARRPNATAAADRPDDAPPTKRDVKAPEQQRTTITRHPIDGAPPSPFGSPPPSQPPGR